jgi:preprotein translocase subunit SecA
LQTDLQQWLDQQQDADADDLLEHVLALVDRMLREKEAMLGSEVMRGLEKHVMLSVLDNGWKEHLASMDYLRQGIYLRGYAQKQPKQEFKREAFELFEGMLSRFKHEIIQMIARVRIRSEDEIEALERQQREQAEAAQGAGEAGFAQATVHREGPKVGRNDPCPCGSGKKYKQCHGKLA